MKKRLEELTPDELQQYAKLNKQRENHKEKIKEHTEIIGHIEEKIENILYIPEEEEYNRDLPF
ncbi:hypothetical protein [Enterococcus phage vB_EfaH_149]|uniref:Uncharacterized protein n=1 Tax=Enterococcus phage vB_EfaH_149 TaxID=2730535 RepID=A0ACA9ATX3_9CAUD|nr:hypothetical protein [Enterococcus phage vB_EfaH_149]CAD0301181.1 Phage protein [Enterococcus phage 156]VDB76954.1 Phage protein [Enterococcus phage 156]